MSDINNRYDAKATFINPILVRDNRGRRNFMVTRKERHARINEKQANVKPRVREYPNFPKHLREMTTYDSEDIISLDFSPGRVTY